jgi:hypothetical protein
LAQKKKEEIESINQVTGILSLEYVNIFTQEEISKLTSYEEKKIFFT